MPEQPHPNCTCTCDVIGSDEKIKPKPPKPKKGNCAKKTSDYGRRTHPTTGELGKMHHGPDFSAPEGTPIKAMEGGKVVSSGPQNPNNLKEGFGQRVKIEHSWGTSTYGHMSEKPKVKEGQQVVAGTELGKVGSTGESTGDHLHYERRDKNGKSFPPSEKELQDVLDMLNKGCK